MTQYIDSITDHFLSIEKDTTLKKKLLSVTTKPIVRGDVLEYDLALLQKDHAYRYEQTVVVGNLPYYITSPILTKFFVDRYDMLGGVFLIQKEVAEKLASDARKKSFLRWLVNNAYHVDYLFTVKPSSFSPPPKVDSAVIRLTKRKAVICEDRVGLKQILSLLSPYKRKTLGKIEKILQAEYAVKIPTSLKKKRLEELGRKELQSIEYR